MRRVFLVLALSGACSNEKSDAPRTPSGSLAGVVRLAPGGSLEPTVVENTTDPEICGERHVLEDALVSRETGGVANVVVALVGAFETSRQELAETTLVLDNRGCRFEPHVAVMTSGGTIEATNSDPVLHTTHLYGPTEVNFSLPAMGVRHERVISQSGTYIIKCDVHGWMQAYVRVDEHPFHAVTDEAGRFRIDGIPQGTHALEAWHERLGRLEATVRIAADQTAEIELEFQLETVP